ncbi:hypothetical protein EYF80_045568 [Liparis tanakae]|uniref:Uncharacterized protein n=1 Tax=Liparis tanakae TaxID=230148 RepID=A0A4Z2FTP2_9TELE|nr:hypothetical protein EYF80_045568 [Liparis tanakae]
MNSLWSEGSQVDISSAPCPTLRNTRLQPDRRPTAAGPPRMSFASSANLSEYSSWSSRTRLSTSSRLTRSLRFRKGDWP